MKRKSIILFLVLLILAEGLAFALIPPPPVNQNMGFYDTLFANLSENKCRACHNSGVPDSHHMLAQSGLFNCMNCHPIITNPDGSQKTTLIRDCLQCHDTTFNGMTIGRPHHESQEAFNGHCKTCHGSVVDNFDDGHYIPAYSPTSMTPDTKFKVINQTSGRKWGGCESCHEQDLTASPFIASNNKTHHRLGNLSGFKNQDNTQCSLCHDLHNATYGSDSIRYCERCHGTTSLHNIQYDIANTTSLPGYGHLGPNDCQGCHASYVAGSLAPGSDYIVPTIESLSTNDVLEGQAAVVTIKGADFVTTVDGVTRSSVVVVSNGTKNVTITPISISHNQIVVTIPGLTKGEYAIYALKDGKIESNRRPFVSVPSVIIITARKVNSSTVVITGSGFGTYDPAFINRVNVTIKRGSTTRSVQIISWSDTMINVLSTSSRTGDIATVNSVYGTNSKGITN